MLHGKLSVNTLNHNSDVVLHAFLVKQATLRVLQGTGSIIEAKLFYSYSKTWLIYTVLLHKIQ